MKQHKSKAIVRMNLLGAFTAGLISSHGLSQGSIQEGNSGNGTTETYQVPCKGFQWGQCSSQCRSATAEIDGGRGCGSLCSRTAQNCASRLNAKLRSADPEKLKRGGWTMETWSREQDTQESNKAWGYISCNLRNWAQSVRDRDSTCSGWL
jgi:hypothetical protein